MKSIFIISILLTLFCLPGNAQIDTIVVKGEIIDGDTVPVVELAEIPILAPVRAIDPLEAKRFAKLVRNVKKVYPYAKLAGARFRELNTQFEFSESRKENRKAIDAVEKEIKDKYGAELKKLTFTQGKILIKLLDRETGNSSYDLVGELKGKMMAFFWQGFAHFWGYNLKLRYDPDGEDQELEQILQKIEKGEL